VRACVRACVRVCVCVEYDLFICVLLVDRKHSLLTWI